MGLGCEMAAARDDVVGILANQLHEPICGIAKGLQIAASFMAVVIGQSKGTARSTVGISWLTSASDAVRGATPPSPDPAP